MTGKGDRERPVDREKYEKNFNRIFGKDSKEPQGKEEIKNIIDKLTDQWEAEGAEGDV